MEACTTHRMSTDAIGAPRPILGSTPGMRKIFEQTEKAGKNRWPVLILGETGTGKELVARAIHQAGTPGPFVVIDCSSIVGALLESELFGHVKGSFTGAVANKIGLLELAHNGTAFLDEIGELPLDAQAKLLRALQEKEFRRVGAAEMRRSNFRVVSATNRDLVDEIKKGRFREDLYYRLNVMKLRLPPLRERKEDLPDLIIHFVRCYGGQQVVTNETMELLLAYDWPGNVRELEHCIQHMLAVASGLLLCTGDLPTTVLNTHCGQTSDLLSIASAVGPSTRRVKSIPEVEIAAIREALLFTKGDRTTAAELLGIGRTTLYRRMKEYAIEVL